MSFDLSLGASNRVQNQTADTAKSLASGKSSSLSNSLLAQKMTTEVATQTTGVANGRMAMQSFNVAADALAGAQGIMGRLNELAVQSSSPTLNGSDRESLQIEADALSTELGDMFDNARFNGQPVMDGGEYSTQVLVHLTLEKADASGITGVIAGLDLSDPSAALSLLEDAQNLLNGEQAKVGAAQARLGREMSSAMNMAANYQEVASAYGGVNVGREAGKLAQGLLQNQVNSAVQKAHNVNYESVGRLLDSLKN